MTISLFQLMSSYHKHRKTSSHFIEKTLYCTQPLFDYVLWNRSWSRWGPGDTTFGLRYKLSEKSWVIAVQSAVKIAAGYETEQEELDSRPPLSDGQTDFEVRLLLVRSLLNHSAYINLDFGYRARSGVTVDEVIYAAEIGYNLSKFYLLSGQISGVPAISEKRSQQDFTIINGMIQNFVGTGALEDFLKAQLQLTYKISPSWDLSFLFERVLLGRNTSQANIVGGGITIHR